MDAVLAARATALGGVISSWDANQLGVPPPTMEALVQRGELIRVRRGAFVSRRVFEAADPTERYRLRTRAILRTRPSVDAASHHAALILRGVRTYDVDLSHVDIAAQVTRTRAASQVRLHPMPACQAVIVEGWRLLPTPLALALTAAASGIVAGVCSFDHALNSGVTTTAQIDAMTALLHPRQAGRVSRALALSDSACESVGESRTRLLLRGLGFRFVSQHEIRRDNRLIARVDFLIEGLVVVEFDGLVKYDGADGRGELMREKQRESDITSLGYEVVRLVWADVADPRRVARMINAALQRARARRPQ